jgi:cobalt/nickel transport system permease protein
VARIGGSCYFEAIVHIPDGFLSTPVWATLDAAAAPMVAYVTRTAQRGFDDAKVPLLGVMGAFVFAAQMINFPVGIGTSGHLVGGALLACTLGPASASVVMSAILVIQALVFQDGGILALGANVVNMAIAGVLAGYLPYHLWGRTRGRRAAIFAGGTLSVAVSAMLALSELLISGVRMPTGVLRVSLGLFLVSALIEGAITMAVMSALEAIQPNLVRQPAAGRRYSLVAAGLAAVLLAAGGVVLASTAPDGIEQLARQAGIAGQAHTLFSTPFKDYQVAWLGAGWPAQAGAGILGVALAAGACVLIGRKR